MSAVVPARVTDLSSSPVGGNDAPFAQGRQSKLPLTGLFSENGKPAAKMKRRPANWRSR